ncbi:MAG: type IV toxin-antitoxin system AbiEi family antitoxin [Anaerolineae bacterium]|jgi:predicted transcriptional regulator of viral defense system
MNDKLTPIYVARRLRQRDLFYFTPSLLADLLRLDRRRAYRLIARLKAKRLITEVEKGKHLLLGLEPERVLSNPLFIASHLVAPTYVSYWSALHFYGFTEQVPLTTFVATTKKKRPVTFRDYRFRFVTIKPSKFFGYRREMVGDLPAIVADEAKAIVDSLDLAEYAGGLGEIAKALRVALEIVDVDALVQYANRVGDKSLGSRLGYLLETLGQPVEGLIKSSSPVKLDVSRSRSGETDPDWQVIVNIPERSLVPQGVGQC